MTRYKAAGIHLAFSILIALVMLVLVFGVWYAHGYYKLLGVGSIYFILMGVDVCLGPLLTLVIYNEKKKELKWDLSIIVILQVAALLYGASVVFQSRPVFNVLENDVFKVTLASELDDKKLALAKNPDWRELSWTGPVIVAAVGSKDPKEKEELVFAALNGEDWNVFPSLYVEYDSQRRNVLIIAKPLSSLRKVSLNAMHVIDVFLESKKRPEANFVYLPIVHSFKVMTAVLDAGNAEFIEIIDIDSRL